MKRGRRVWNDKKEAFPGVDVISVQSEGTILNMKNDKEWDFYKVKTEGMIIERQLRRFELLAESAMVLGKTPRWTDQECGREQERK